MENRQLSDIIKENVLLKDYSTFKIGGPAKYFCACQNEEEIKIALDFAIVNKLQVFVLGHGSNLLISDSGFDGLVLKMGGASMDATETRDGCEVTAGSGLYLMKMILDLQKNGVGGLEWAAGIPGSIGGAVCNNAGAHGKNMGGAVQAVRAFEMSFNAENGYLEKYNLREVPKSQCAFSYRGSIFKNTKKYAILDAVLLLQKRGSEEIMKEIEENIKFRTEKQPLGYPNIGSIFKNPASSEEEMKKLFQKYPEAENLCKGGTIPAGWLVEQAGLKGKKIGGAMVSEKHANFIVNTGNAKAEDAVILISLIKQKVRTKFDIQLHEEIEYVGF